jgi:hypothetical protein
MEGKEFLLLFFGMLFCMVCLAWAINQVNARLGEHLRKLNATVKDLQFDIKEMLNNSMAGGDLSSIELDVRRIAEKLAPKGEYFNDA